MTDGPNETGSFRRQIPPEGHVTLRFEKFSSFVEEYRAGISLGGVFIKTHRPRPIGTEVHFEFKLTDGFRLLHGQGIVVWQRLEDQGPEAPAGMGVRFTAIDESGRQLVLKLLEEQVKAGGAPFEVERVPEGAVSSNSAVTVQPETADDEEPTLVGASVQELNPSLPNPSALPVQKQAELGFDAPWGKKLPGVPQDLLAEESDPEVDKAVSTIRPSIPASAPVEGGQTAPSSEGRPAAPQAAAAEPVVPQPSLEPAAPSAPPVSSNQAVTPVAPPIAQSDGAGVSELGDPTPAVDLELGGTEDPTLVGTGASPAPEPAAQQGVLPLTTPPATPSPSPAIEVATAGPVESAAPPASPQPDPSLEDSMMEAADEVEATVELEDPVIDFDPPAEDISFDPGPADPDPEFSFDEDPAAGESGSGESTAPSDPAGLEPGLEPTAEMPTFDAPPSMEEGDTPSFETAPADEPSFEAPSIDAPSFEAPSIDAPSFEAPGADAPSFDSPSFDAPSFDAPSFETPTFDTSSTVEEPDAFAPMDSGEAGSSTDILPTSDLPSFTEAGTEPAPSAVAPTPAPLGDLPAAVPSFESSPADAPSFDQPGPAEFAPPAAAPASEGPAAGSAGGSSLFAQPGTELAAVGGASATPHVADFVDSWPSSEEDPDAWMEEGEDFSPPARRGAGRYLIALGLVTALVAAVYFFRGPLSGLVGLSSGTESRAVVSQKGNAGGPAGQRAEKPAKKGGNKGTKEDAAASETAAEGAGAGEGNGAPNSDPLQEEVIEVGAEPDGSGVGAEVENLPDSEASPGSAAPATSSEPAKEPVVADAPRPQPSTPSRSQQGREAERAPTQTPGGARLVTGIDWNRGSQGTRVTIAFSGPVSAGDFRHDPLGWAADREMLSLLGVENYPKGEIAVGTDELRRIRLGFHPGQELRLVFDLGKAGAAIQEVKPVGTRLEILIQ